MDEATSALDSITETAVMDAIYTLMHTKTIIMIAHRISTVQPCDRIYIMERGEIVDERKRALQAGWAGKALVAWTL